MIGLSGPNRSNEVAQKNPFLCISSYIDETQQIMHESFRFQTGDTLKGIVSMLLADKMLVNKQEAGCNISEELVSVAALARLMASSLFRAVSEARTMDARAQKAGKRYRHLELEGQLMGSLGLESNAGHCLVGRKADQIVRRILHDAISAGSAVSRKRSVLMLQHFMKLMLQHFMKLMLVGLRARAGFLWKACVLVMSAIMNLMAFEGVEFDALKILAGDAHEPVETTKVHVSFARAPRFDSCWQRIFAHIPLVYAGSQKLLQSFGVPRLTGVHTKEKIDSIDQAHTRPTGESRLTAISGFEPRENQQLNN